MKTVKVILVVAALGVIGTTRAQEKRINKEQKQRFFQQLDSNVDGKISVAEFNSAKAKREAARIERRKARFTALDANKDGALSFEEFNANYRKMATGTMSRDEITFESIDTDKDGFLTQEELRESRTNFRKSRDLNIRRSTQSRSNNRRFRY